MYFIAAGEVTVRLPNFQVTLKEGDFVGEMGLISDGPRSADVVSDGYCHLLALYRKDFRALLDKRPAVRSRDRSHGRPPHRRERGQGGSVIVFRTAGLPPALRARVSGSRASCARLLIMTRSWRPRGPKS